MTEPLPDTLEALTLYLERRGWSWKLTSYADEGGHRTYRALVYRPNWPPSFGRRKQLAGTAVEALTLALWQARAKSAELSRRHAPQP